MQLTLIDNLPFTQITIAYQKSIAQIDNVLVDTGSASTILAADTVSSVQIAPLPNDVLHTIRGVGGTEVVFIRQTDFLQVGERSLPDFEIEVGGMDYGFAINGILGMDFLTRAGAIINLSTMQIEFSD